MEDGLNGCGNATEGCQQTENLNGIGSHEHHETQHGDLLPRGDGTALQSLQIIKTISIDRKALLVFFYGRILYACLSTRFRLSDGGIEKGNDDGVRWKALGMRIQVDLVLGVKHGFP